MNRIEKLVRENIRNLCPYSTARDEYKGKLGVFLDANESPYDTGYNRYPDPHQLLLKERISQIKGVPVENIFLGNGSDEAIDLVFRIFCRPGVDNAVIITPSYGMYSVCADINDVQARMIPLGEGFSLPSEAILKATDSNSKLLFICSPNNPSGNAFDQDEMLELVKKFPGIVIVDEAYVDFSTKGSLRRKVLEYDNLIVLQTLSKAWGLAALRLGIAYASEYITRLMGMVKYPYNINLATQQAVLKALQNPIDERVAQIIEQRTAVAQILRNFNCVKKIYPSDANFILVQVDDANKAYEHFIADGIIVRNRNNLCGCSGCLRITIGLPEENKKMIKSFEEYEKGNIRR